MKLLEHTEDIKLICYDLAEQENLEIRDAEDAYRHMAEEWERIDAVQQFRMLMLDSHCRVVSFYHLTNKGIGRLTKDTDLLFSKPMMQNVECIILAHNMPGGNVEQSVLELTKTIIKRANKEGLYVMDHLIVSRDGYCSAIGQDYLAKRDVLAGANGKKKINSIETEIITQSRESEL